MIFKNAELYNVSELEDAGDGSFYMLRMPKNVMNGMHPKGAPFNRNNCGVEIRFNLSGKRAKIKMCYGDDPYGSDDDNAENKITSVSGNVYFGNIPSGWEHCIKPVYNRPTELIIENPYDKALLKRISEENNYPFDPNVVRLILPNQRIRIIDIDGDITPPEPKQLPKKKYLAYGSSITHGSIGLSAVNTYAFRTAENLGADLINLGFAGSARLEKCVADYIASRDDWDFASLEMGVNIMDIDPEDYRERITYFINTVAGSHPDKKVFCIDIFYNSSDLTADNKAATFRKIMKETTDKLNLKNVVYINGLEILNSAAGLSADLVHPNNTAIPEMGKRLSGIIGRNL